MSAIPSAKAAFARWRDELQWDIERCAQSPEELLPLLLELAFFAGCAEGASQALEITRSCRQDAPSTPR